MCVLHERLGQDMCVSGYLIFLKYGHFKLFYMGKMGKQYDRTWKFPKMLKKFRDRGRGMKMSGRSAPNPGALQGLSGSDKVWA